MGQITEEKEKDMFLKKQLFMELQCEGFRKNAKEKKGCKKEEEIDCGIDDLSMGAGGHFGLAWAFTGENRFLRIIISTSFYPPQNQRVGFLKKQML